MSEHDAGPGLLSVVATPIGNLEDITLRALRTLREADVVLAEDTRRTRILCQQHGIAARLRALHAHSSMREVERALRELAEGKRLALVTDAGTPLVSDPGAQLVAAARERGLRVEAVPGPSAVTAALMVGGIACDRFRFVGFLPRGGKQRRSALAEIAGDRAASVVFESPQRLAATLAELARTLGDDRQVAVCRELTKLHEEVVRGPVSELARRFAGGTRGEITLIVAGNDGSARPETVHDEQSFEARIDELLRSGHSVKDAVRALGSQTALDRQALYARVQSRKEQLQDGG